MQAATGSRRVPNDPQGKPEPPEAEGPTANQLRQAASRARQKLATSERRTCNVIGLARSSMQYQAVEKHDDALRLAMIRLAKSHGCHGYRTVTELLRIEGWRVNHSWRRTCPRWGRESAGNDRAPLERGRAATSTTAQEAAWPASRGQLDHPAATDASEPRPERRFRPRQARQWAQLQDADGAG